jgi:hypothetical protein
MLLVVLICATTMNHHYCFHILLKSFGRGLKNCSYFNSRYRHLAAWLGLFAMLMVYIAPLVSQSLLMPKVHQPVDHAHHSMQTMHHDAGLSLHHAWCGYCKLLYHLSSIDFDVPQLTPRRAVVLWVTVSCLSLVRRFHCCKTPFARAPPV